MKLTRHNGRSGKNGTYNPRHNDRRFDVGNSEHINGERTKRNIYWDCYQGLTTVQDRESGDSPNFSFERIEKAYYFSHYGEHIDAQNERNERNRHPERNRTVDDLLANSKTCPEESIYQIGTIEESADTEKLVLIVHEFFTEFELRFGSHVHILDWALHLDEGTPHIHERHVFDCKNKYGELCPQQEKALEKLGFQLPDPEKPKGKNNNRKQIFDAVCRTMLFEIAQKHGFHLDQEPEYGGRKYLEKQDFIIAKQNEAIVKRREIIQKQDSMMAEKTAEISEAQEELKAITMKLSDMEALVDEVADVAYKKACDVVADTVREETLRANMEVISNYKKWATASERKISEDKKDLIAKCLDVVLDKLLKAVRSIRSRVQAVLSDPNASGVNRDWIKMQTRESVMERLEKAKAESERLDKERRGREDRSEVKKNRDI